jgi:phosphoribosylaminoimidazolecarboxamide formyltransferase/IMP cyclohydrolase
MLQGKPLSYNNILDADAAWAVVSDFSAVAPAVISAPPPPTAHGYQAQAGALEKQAPQVTVAIIKHTNPCGLARAGDPLAAYDLALAGDPLAAFGGIVAVSAPVDGALARRVVERFWEILLAPEFSAEALAVLAARPNLRVLALPPSSASGLRWRSVEGGVLVQTADGLDDSETDQGHIVTRRAQCR